MPASVVFATSSAPFGVSETWLQSEVSEIARTRDVYLAPILGRGERQNWPNAKYLSNGSVLLYPKAILRLLRKPLRDVWKFDRNDEKFRSYVKKVLAALRGTVWGMQFRREGISVRLVVASFASGPAVSAVAMAQILDAKVSVIGHRFDIEMRAPKWVYRRVDLTRAISVSAQHEFLNRGIDSQVIPLGVVDELRPRDSTSKELSCVAIGQLVPRKGHEQAIRAVAGLKAEGIYCSLDIVGEGPLKDRLHEIIEDLGVGDRVRLRGPVQRVRLLEMLGDESWNILVHPSVVEGDLVEGIPAVILEAASRGLAVIASPSGGTSEYLVDGFNGLEIRGTNATEQIESLSFLIKKVARYSDLLEALTCGGFQSLERFTATSAVTTVFTTLEI